MATEREILEQVASGDLSVDEAAELLEVAQTDPGETGEEGGFGLLNGPPGFGPGFRAPHAPGGFAYSFTTRGATPATPPTPPVPPVPPRAPRPPRPPRPPRARGRHVGSASFGGRVDPDTLIALAGLGVSPEWIRSMRQAGLDDLDPDTLIGLAGIGVSPEWINAMRDVGIDDLDGDTLIGLAGVGATPDWIKSLQDAGIGDLDGDTLIALAGVGASPEWVQAMLGELDEDRARAAQVNADDDDGGGDDWTGLEPDGGEPDASEPDDRA